MTEDQFVREILEGYRWRDELGSAGRVRVIRKDRVRRTVGKVRNGSEQLDVSSHRGRPAGRKRGRRETVEIFTEHDYCRTQFILQLRWCGSEPYAGYKNNGENRDTAHDN